MLATARWLLFALSAAGAVISSVRVASRLCSGLVDRILSSVVLAAATAIVDVLVLGLFGWGANGPAIAAVSVAQAAVTLVIVPATTPAVRDQVREAWHGLSIPARGGLGAFSALVVAWTANLVDHPIVGADGLTYHLAEPAIWISDGHPGSLHTLLAGLPTQAYPKDGELLYFWTLATTRTPIATTLILMTAYVVMVLALWTVLSRLNVPRWLTPPLAVSMALSPLALDQTAGPSTDLLTMTWVLVTAALCLSDADAGLVLPVALISGGLAAGTKTTGLPLVTVMLVLAGWRSRQQLRARLGQPLQHSRALIAAVVVVLATGVVWYLEDLVVYGAPFYPFSRFPAGPRLPVLITVLGARLFFHPIFSIRSAGAAHYVRALGAAVPLAVTGLMVGVLAQLPGNRKVRRAVTLAVAAAVLETVAYSLSPTSGFADIDVPGAASLVIGATRYLLPGMWLYAVVLGLAARGNGSMRVLAGIGAIAGVGFDLPALRSAGETLRPSVVVMLISVAVGVLAAVITVPLSPGGAQPVWLHRRLHVPGASDRNRPRWLAASAVAAVIVGALVGLRLATPGYLDRHIKAAHGGSDAPLISAMTAQPRWLHGNEPVVAGPVADALLAGPTFDHALSVIGENTPCEQVRALARTSWMVLSSGNVKTPASLGHRFDRAQCLLGVPPFYATSGLRAYAPTG